MTDEKEYLQNVAVTNQCQKLDDHTVKFYDNPKIFL